MDWFGLCANANPTMVVFDSIRVRRIQDVARDVGCMGSPQSLSLVVVAARRARRWIVCGGSGVMVARWFDV